MTGMRVIQGKHKSSIRNVEVVKWSLITQARINTQVVIVSFAFFNKENSDNLTLCLLAQKKSINGNYFKSDYEFDYNSIKLNFIYMA